MNETYGFQFTEASDLGHLWVAGIEYFKTQPGYIQPVSVADQLATVTTNLSMAELRRLLLTLPRGHLMADTLRTLY